MAKTLDYPDHPGPTNWAEVYARRIETVLADLDHVQAKGATTHHDACWDEHIACLAARIHATLTGEDPDRA